MAEEAMNEDLIGDPVVPEIINSNFEAIQPSPQKKHKSDLIVALENTEAHEEVQKTQKEPLGKAQADEVREPRKSLTHQKELLAIKLRQK